jgi:RNA polymerase-binding transcription factor DksA
MSDDPVRAALVAARTAAQAQVEALGDDLRGVIDAARSSNADDEHDPEGATIAFERAQATALLAAAGQRVADLDAALARVDTGTYGICEACDRPIPAERLAARPAARTCVTCAARR